MTIAPSHDGPQDGPQPDMHAAVHNLVQFFEQLTPESLAQLPLLYAPTARFKDPFNAVQGLPAIQRIFTHMFETLDAPRFHVTGRVVQGSQCFLVWEFQFRLKRFDTATLQTVHGCTHLIFDAEDRVSLHRDYWDAAEELYEKLPLLGPLMRWLKRHAAGPLERHGRP